jgi:PIN domain nuclease of toxin-antitoxin system
MLNLDTHILVHALAGGLTPRERSLLSHSRWSISAIVLWELDLDSPEFARALSKIHVWPLDLTVCRRIRNLDIRSDPADEIIAATSIVHNVPLLTRDRAIRKSKLVPLA